MSGWRTVERQFLSNKKINICCAHYILTSPLNDLVEMHTIYTTGQTSKHLLHVYRLKLSSLYEFTVPFVCFIDNPLSYSI